VLGSGIWTCSNSGNIMAAGISISAVNDVSSLHHFPAVKCMSVVHCAETNLQVNLQQKPFDLYRPATGHCRDAENTNNLQKCFINVGELLQICRKTTILCFVSLVPTWP
jgi:hypothetical protein